VRIRASGKAAGILVGDEKLAKHYIDIGFTFVAVGSDIGVLARGAEALAATFQTGE
jgi:4-hydroxy-2-oxoheptanedioate aldolase